VTLDPIEAGKWYVLARAGGITDDWLESYLATLSERDMIAVRKRAARYNPYISLSETAKPETAQTPTSEPPKP
jgi:hypothetical protein